MHTPLLTLSRGQINTLYPYFLILSEDFQILEAGMRLQQLLPSVTSGASFHDLFTIVEPRQGFGMVTSERPATMVISAPGLRLPLRGTLLFQQDLSQYVFLGSIWVRDIAEVAQAGLILKDIPQHDSSLDYLVALQALRTAFAESRSFAEKLSAERMQLRETNKRLKASEEKYRSVVESVKEVIFQTDCEGNWTFLNRAWGDITEYPIDETLGRPVLDFVVPQDRSHNELHFKRLLAGEVEYERHETRFWTWNGQVRWLEVLAQAMVGPQGEITGISGTLFDITERKAAEEELRALTQDLQRSNRDLSDFATVASHDLQEPLRKIMIFSDQVRLSLRSEMPQNALEYSEKMGQAARRMQSLIQGLLNYSRVTSRARPFAEICLDQIVADVLIDLDTMIQKVAGTVTVASLPTIHADPTQMRQLLQNLIENALKFYRKGVPPEVHIYATVYEESGRAMMALHCCDNGIGFESQFKDKVFEVFERLHSVTEYDGTGIGLSICRKIVERHHGRIEANSVPGEGTEFIVRLPLRQG